MNIAKQVEQVREKIAAACARANRNPDEVTLVAVSKRKPVEDIIAAMEAGITHFGENRLGESERKLPAVNEALGSLSEPVWHFVGHIQSRKTSDILPMFPIIHSLDSVKLANKMSRIAVEDDFQPRVFIQVNISGEDQKYGFEAYRWEEDESVRQPLLDAVQHILDLPALDVRGIMTMAPYEAPEAELREIFSSAAHLRRELESKFDVSLPELSMGMTNDYEIAIEEGATVVRVGRAIFGERQY